MATTKKPAAKKAAPKNEVPVEAPIVSFDNIDKPLKEIAKPKWEYKDRLYEMTQAKKPLVYSIPTRHSAKVPLLYFDEEKGYNRELRYATNQKSCFVDEQEGPVTMGRIVFREGALSVPKENVALQQMLSLYHPYTKQEKITEYNPVAEAEQEVAGIEDALEAMNMAASMDIDQAEAIMRVELGSAVSTMSSKELKRDLLVFANKNPYLFLELANDDNVHLRNIGIRATEMGIIKLSSDNRTFSYGSTDRKLMTVPFDEHPYSALAAYFKTDEGMEVLNAIEKRL